MKKLIIAFLLSIGTFTAFSQQKGSFELGVNVGYNGATVSNGTQTNSSSRNGLNLGISGDYFFSDRWSIKSKLTYDQKGWDRGYIQDLNGQSYTTDYRLDYITIPVMANWHFGKKRNWYLHFGPYLGFLMSAKDTRFNIDLKSMFQSVDAGLDLGIGVKIPVSQKTKLFFELDGQSGFADINAQYQANKFLNSRSSINIGFVFDLK
ncbi:porin family protein [Pedobacter sp. UBA4863]|uniref:porin family protein n=1 Tax=Pedobacter sp. UBA4863 TaxID=1947060 RepID=UPI0025D2A244|nr:porin family protein [Pedobacter sp. UBA4863]